MHDRTRRPRPIDAARLQRSALHHVARFACTRARLAAVLQRRVDAWVRAGDPRPPDATALIEALVAKMVEAQLLDDDAFARGRVESLSARGTSKRGIAQRLRQRGVSNETAARALVQTDDLAAAVRYVARRRLHGVDRQKALASLGRQGFSYDVARRALDVGSGA